MNPPAPLSRPDWLREATGGLVTGAVAVVYAVSYAALLFQGALRDLLPWGIGMALVSATLGAFWLAWRSELPFAIGGPDGNTTSILAAMTAGVTSASVVTTGAAAGSAPLAHVLLLMLVTTLLCAAVFLALGFGRLGAWVRYIPFPVIGGFLASSGWLIATGALKVVADVPAGAGWPGALPAHLADPRVLVTVAFALAYLAVFRRERHPFVLPAVLAASALAVLAALALAGHTGASARQAGWLFEGLARIRWMAPWELAGAAPHGVDWGWIAGQWPGMLAVVAVAAITVLLGASGLEVMSQRDISLDHELRTHGWLNVLAACCGGYVSLVSVSRSALLLQSGATTRAAGMLAAAVCALAAAGAALLLGWVPKAVLGAFLLYLGLAILREWVVDARRRLNRADWALVLAILAITATVGFAPAVLAGILASCLNFALNYSRVGVVQHDLDGTAAHSSVVRPAAHRELLARHGKDIRVLVLRGVVFFGTANAVLERVRGFLVPEGAGVERRVLVLDFTHVASADSSAAMTFTKLSQLAQAGGVTLLLCGLNRATQDALARMLASGAVRCVATLDQALDAAEEILLAARRTPGGAGDGTGSLREWLLRELGAPHHVERLLPLLRRRELAAGQPLLAEGDASDATLYLVERGRLAVTLRGQGEGKRLASLMGGNMVGEMALYSNADRSANVTAEQDSVVWSLAREALEGLHATAPDTAMQVHAFVVRTLAERLRLANGTIAALQRGA